MKSNTERVQLLFQQTDRAIRAISRDAAAQLEGSENPWAQLCTVKRCVRGMYTAAARSIRTAVHIYALHLAGYRAAAERIMKAADDLRRDAVQAFGRLHELSTCARPIERQDALEFVGQCRDALSRMLREGGDLPDTALPETRIAGGTGAPR